MTGERTLDELLADALGRVAETETRVKDRPALSKTETLKILRSAALLYGLDSEQVVVDFQRDGPLADLVRAVIGAEKVVRPKRGAPPKRESFNSFCRVCELMDVQGLTKEKSIAKHAAETGKPESTIARRYERWLSRKGARRPKFTGRLSDLLML